MKSLDRWSAEKLGIELEQCPSGDPIYYIVDRDKVNGAQFWTLDDARCREIVREHFGISTNLTIQPHKLNESPMWSCYKEQEYLVYGKTIAEAELLCIEAIKQGEE